MDLQNNWFLTLAKHIGSSIIGDTIATLLLIVAGKLFHTHLTRSRAW